MFCSQPPIDRSAPPSALDLEALALPEGQGLACWILYIPEALNYRGQSRACQAQTGGNVPTTETEQSRASRLYYQCKGLERILEAERLERILERQRAERILELSRAEKSLEVWRLQQATAELREENALLREALELERLETVELLRATEEARGLQADERREADRLLAIVLDREGSK